MKFTVDKKEVFTLLEWHKSLIKNDIPSEIFKSDMIRRVIYSIDTPIMKFINKNKKEIHASLKKQKILEVPGGRESFANFLGSRENLGFSPTEITDGCPIECDVTEIYNVTPSYLTLIKSCLRLEELSYLDTQINWALNGKIKECLKRMHSAWDPKLASRSLNIPLDDEAFVNLVTSQSDYKDRSVRVDILSSLKEEDSLTSSIFVEELV